MKEKDSADKSKDWNSVDTSQENLEPPEREEAKKDSP